MWRLMENIIEEDDLSSLVSFLHDTDRFTNGPKVVEFEDSWSNWLGNNYSTMVNSGASANFLSIAIVKHLFGVGEVIVPSLGWSSDVSSIVQLGMVPVFVDVDEKTLGLNANSLKAAFSENTKAVVIVHALGFNAITEEVRSILDDAGVFVIEDCCEAHGARIDLKSNSKVGTYGDLSLFSFYFGHHISTIEGGMVCSKNEELHQLSKMFRSHGMTREASEAVKSRYKNEFPELNPLFTFAVAGFNFRSTELNAVLGLSQIKKLDSNILQRQRHLERWLSVLDCEKYQVSFSCEGNSNFALPLILRWPDPDLFRDVCLLLEDNSVEYRIGTAGGGNLSKQPFLKEFSYRIADDQKVVDHIHKFGLYVGNGSHVQSERIEQLARALNELETEV